MMMKPFLVLFHFLCTSNTNKYYYTLQIFGQKIVLFLQKSREGLLVLHIRIHLQYAACDVISLSKGRERMFHAHTHTRTCQQKNLDWANHIHFIGLCQKQWDCAQYKCWDTLLIWAVTHKMKLMWQKYGLSPNDVSAVFYPKQKEEEEEKEETYWKCNINKFMCAHWRMTSEW